MLLEQLKEKKNFTGNECVIAEYVLKHMSEIGEYSAQELANATFTSKASVIRFCKKLNADGYRNFQRKLESEANELYRIYNLLHKEPVNAQSSLHDIIQILPSIYETAVSKTKIQFDESVLREVIQRLRETSCLEIYGSGVCQSIARIAAFKFQTIGYNCVAFEGLNEHYVMAKKQEMHKTAILLTFSGSNPYILRTAKYLKRCGYYIVGIGGTDHAALKSYCSSYIEVYSKELILSLEILTSYSAMNYVLDVLFVTLLTQKYAVNVQVSLDVMNSKDTTG